MSSTSLGMQQQSHQSPHSLRDKLSLPRLRSRTPSNVGLNDVRSPSHASPVSRIATPPHADVYRDDSSLLGRSSTSSGPQYEYSHPYANPDLVRALATLIPAAAPDPDRSITDRRIRDMLLAELARQHNDANILSLPARFTSIPQAVAITRAFLETSFEGGRHANRVEKISCR